MRRLATGPGRCPGGLDPFSMAPTGAPPRNKSHRLLSRLAASRATSFRNPGALGARSPRSTRRGPNTSFPETLGRTRGAEPGAETSGRLGPAGREGRRPGPSGGELRPRRLRPLWKARSTSAAPPPASLARRSRPRCAAPCPRLPGPVVPARRGPLSPNPGPEPPAPVRPGRRRGLRQGPRPSPRPAEPARAPVYPSKVGLGHAASAELEPRPRRVTELKMRLPPRPPDALTSYWLTPRADHQSPSARPAAAGPGPCWSRASRAGLLWAAASSLRSGANLARAFPSMVHCSLFADGRRKPKGMTHRLPPHLPGLAAFRQPPPPGYRPPARLPALPPVAVLQCLALQSLT